LYDVELGFYEEERKIKEKRPIRILQAKATVHKIEDVLREISPLFQKTRTCTTADKMNTTKRKNTYIHANS